MQPRLPHFVLVLALGAAALGLSARRPLAPEDGPAVALSRVCASCHRFSERASAMRDAEGRAVAPFDLWRSSMMANAARDPFWRAVMSVEIEAAPSRREDIERKCLGCHTPLASRIGLEAHGTDSLAHVLECDGELGDAARDGVSCTVCHGMSPAGLGTAASFTAGFELDADRRLYGPHPDPFPGPMRMHTGFEPTQGEHVTESALCGTCHTLVTHALDAAGGDTGLAFHEQTPYLEWRNSAFDEERARPGPDAASCQDCHVPTRDVDGRPIETRIAHNPGGRDFPFLRPREPFGRHVFVGGNVLVLQLLRDHGPELLATAPREAFAATLAAAREQLTTRTARVAVGDLKPTADRLRFRVDVVNLTGHKFPTGHPSRRAWLRVRVLDEAGRALFASGDWDATGRLVDGSGHVPATEEDGGPVQPHRTVVAADDEVARFRAVMADSKGAATYRLLRGADWWVDDRLLPRGWDPEHADAGPTRPVGTADDPDFGPGRDGVRYELPRLAGAAVLAVELCYQPVSPRWVAELAAFDTPEVRTFLDLWRDADRSPVVIARQRVPLR